MHLQPARRTVGSMTRFTGRGLNNQQGADRLGGRRISLPTVDARVWPAVVGRNLPRCGA